MIKTELLRKNPYTLREENRPILSKAKEKRRRDARPLYQKEKRGNENKNREERTGNV